MTSGHAATRAARSAPGKANPISVSSWLKRLYTI